MQKTKFDMYLIFWDTHKVKRWKAPVAVAGEATGVIKPFRRSLWTGSYGSTKEIFSDALMATAEVYGKKNLDEYLDGLISLMEERIWRSWKKIPYRFAVCDRQHLFYLFKLPDADRSVGTAGRNGLIPADYNSLSVLTFIGNARRAWPVSLCFSGYCGRFVHLVH